ncbi:MAG: AMP-binding protein [bacterium]|nr:AMP-binding protein [bacterium]
MEAYKRAGINPQFTYDGQTILDLFDATVARNPNGVALVMDIGPISMKMTYRKLAAESRRFAAGLAGRNIVRPGDRVAFHLPNTPQFLIAYLAVLRLGGTLTPTFPRAPKQECADKWADAEVKVLITLDIFLESDLAVARGLPCLEHVVATHVSDCFPFLKRMILSQSLKKRSAWRNVSDIQVVDGATVHEWRALSGISSGESVVSAAQPDGLALLLYTGGTSGGLPKAAMLTHANTGAHAMKLPRLFPNFKTDGEVIASFLPYHHSFGITVCLGMALAHGVMIVLIPRPFEEKGLLKRYTPILRAVRKYRATILPSSPFLFEQLLADPALTRDTLASVRYCISGAAPLSADLRNQFEQKTGVEILEGYGMSEACSGVAINSSEIATALHARGTDMGVGMPVPGTDIEIRNEDGAEVPLGEIGEICVYGPEVMKGYLNKPEPTAIALRDEWLHTGDLGFVDTRGFLHVTGLKKEMINFQDGRKAFPEEIEAVLRAHPSVADCAVIRAKDERRGEVPRALVVLVSGEAPTKELESHIGDFTRSRLDYKYPRIITFVPEIPRSPDGMKILRGKLKELYS